MSFLATLSPVELFVLLFAAFVFLSFIVYAFIGRSNESYTFENAKQTGGNLDSRGHNINVNN